MKNAVVDDGQNQISGSIARAIKAHGETITKGDIVVLVNGCVGQVEACLEAQGKLLVLAQGPLSKIVPPSFTPFPSLP